MATALMFGRVSYEAFSPMWPNMEDFAALKELPKYVVSTTLSEDALVDNWGPITILRSVETWRSSRRSTAARYHSRQRRLARNLS